MKNVLLVLVLAASMPFSVFGAIVTGNPASDGWTSGGNALANGIYARGSANYGFCTYSGAITVQSSSVLAIDDGEYSWLAGDTVLGLGGQFEDITASEAGWSSFTGNAVNVLLSEEYGPKLIGKFGTSAATFSASSTAPSSGNGVGSTSAGGAGTVFVRTSGWFHDYTPLSSQTTDTTWSANSGELMRLDKSTHISREGVSVTPDDRVARVIWYWDPTTENVLSWEILLNVSLLDRTAPADFTGLTPSAGDLAIISVQDRDYDYTDAVVTIVPEPLCLILLSLGGLTVLRRKN